MINVKNLVLGVGIVIVFALVLWQGIEAFYPSPQWDDFCGEIIVEPLRIDDGLNPPKVDIFSECQSAYDEAKDNYAKVVFIISLVVGLMAFLVGHLVLNMEPVGSALIGSGIWAIFWGAVINWRNFSDVWRFLLLLLALILLIWLAIQSNQKKKSFLSFLKR